MSGPPLVEIRDLHLHFPTYGGTVQALRGVDLTIHEGETVGLVGESGCGKTLTALTLLRLAPTPPGRYVKGQARYHRRARGERAWVDLVRLPERALLAIRGRDIAMIFQDPMTSLNPVLTVGDQITEAIVTHQDVGVAMTRFDRWLLRRGIRSRQYRKAQRAATPRAIELLRSIGIADPDKVVERHPHELSGGMRQRVMIAIALSCNPDLLVADEPTTALDVTIQAQIMALLQDLKGRTNAAILLITHHMGLVAEMADRVAVMYAGQVVEDGPTAAVFSTPKHPYTLGLLSCIPNLATRPSGRLPVIPGAVPDMLDPPPGCPFHPRCPFALPRCSTEPPAMHKHGAQRVACHLYDGFETVPDALKGRDAAVFARKEAARP